MDLDPDALCVCEHPLYMHATGSGPCAVCAISPHRTPCPEFRPRCLCGASVAGEWTAGVRHGAHRCARVITRQT